MGITRFRIRDPILGDIKADAIELSVISTPEMQRLRRVSQNGFVSFVYPGATHTRFSHSLGTMQITKEIYGNIFNNDSEELYLAALLHDIGHAPFSHSTDGILRKYLHTDHEKLGEQKIRNGVIKDIISSTHSFNKFLRYFEGKGIGIIFTGALGADRMDYLARDAYYTGVSYGVIDLHRLKYKLRIEKGKLAVYNYDVPVAEAMLIARYLMFNVVYNHHTTIIATSMYEKALSQAIESREIDAKSIIDCDDGQLTSELLNAKASSHLAKKLFSRELYKRAVYTEASVSVSKEEVIAALEKSGEEEFIVEKIKMKGNGDDLYVIDKDDSVVGTLSEISPIVKSINDVIKSKTVFLVACERSRVEKVKRIVGKLI
ncbi:MAG: HD domain-containing protein [Candidatus Micrarchaeaceae archaeon]